LSDESHAEENRVLPVFLIGLREGLEASLVVSILVAYLVKTDRRSALPAVWTGVGIAVALSLGFGALLTYTSTYLSFKAQEAMGGILSILAVCFVTWMIFWMRRAARSIKGELQGAVDRALEMGTGALVLTAFVAVGREGLETALFIWSAAQSGGVSDGPPPIVGAALGLAVAVLLGYLLYRGAITINLGRFFTWTGAALVVVAGGVLAYGFHDLQEAGILPGLNDLAFDVSDTITPGSVAGTLLKGVFNFSPQTTWVEAAVWLLYVPTVMFLFLRPGSRKAPRAPEPASATEPAATA
jgi:high-affinity iron transporter